VIKSMLVSMGLLALSAPEPAAATKVYVIIPHRASATEIFAGTELQRILRCMTGRTPEMHLDHPAWGDPQKKKGLTFLVGRTRFAKPLAEELSALGPDGFIMRHQGNVVFLVGTKDRGTLYAVYTYLHQAGCRWFGPASEDHHIPRVETAALPFADINEVQRPSFACRELVSFTSIDEADIDWCTKNRLNRAGHQSRLPAAWGHIIAEYWRARGGTVLLRYTPVHNFTNLVPASLFKTHPDYFALIDGKRRARALDAYWQSEFATQFCTTHKDVVERIRREVIAWFDAHPDYEVFALGPVDGGQWCQCERCRAMDTRPGVYSERLVHLANQVAESLVVKHPTKHVMILAYDNYKYPPKGIRPHPNVSIQPCLWPSIQQPLSRQPEEGAIYADALRGWAELTDNLALWTYVFYIGAGNAPPAISVYALAEDLAYYRKIGVKRLLSEFRSDLFQQQPLALYVWTRLTWDANADVRQLIGDFCKAYYGAASDAMASFYTLVEDTNAARRATTLLEVYTPDVAKKAQSLLDDAAKAVTDDELRRRRVATVRAQVDRAAKLAGPKIASDRWVHVAFTWDFPAGAFALYLDGQRVAEATGSFEPPVLAPRFITGRQYHRADGVQGMIDELHLADVPRTTFPAAGKDPQPEKPDSHTTMLCHFDKGLDADAARGDASVQPTPWPFTHPELAAVAGFGKAALLRSSGTRGRHDALPYVTAGNLDPTRGTVAMRYRPSLWRVGPITCTLLDAREQQHPGGFWIRLHQGHMVVHFGGAERLKAALPR